MLQVFFGGINTDVVVGKTVSRKFIYLLNLFILFYLKKTTFLAKPNVWKVSR